MIEDRVVDAEHGLDISHYKNYLNAEEEKQFFDVVKQIPWYRVKYASERHGNQCETPCWTNMFGGYSDLKPYQPVPECFTEMRNRLVELTGVPFNAVLVRLYFDGSDNIAWHTDGRVFLGPQPVIASLSLGAKSVFQLRKMTDVWPTSKTPNGGVDSTVAQKELLLHGGDLLVMRGRTQQCWHHRVPKATYRAPRININFRYIIDERSDVSLKGVRAFYKYMVSGDEKTEDWSITASSYNYDDIVKRNSSLSPVSIASLLSKKRPMETTKIDVNSYKQPKIAVMESLESISKQYETSMNRLNAVECLSTWPCTVCTYENDAEQIQCEICETPALNKNHQTARIKGNETPVKKTTIMSLFKKK